jgi:hypothetical protein
MAVLIAIVLLVGAMCLLDLLLTFGVIRRLREHTETLERLVGMNAGTANAPAVGRSAGPITASTVDGEPISLAGTTAVIFAATGCETCHRELPDLVAWAGARDRERVLVVVSTSQSDDGEEFATALGKVAKVVLDPDPWPVCEAFDVRSFPRSCVVVDGTVIAAETNFSRLPALV